jgi:hypothetical protein
LERGKQASGSNSMQDNFHWYENYSQASSVNFLASHVL